MNSIPQSRAGAPVESFTDAMAQSPPAPRAPLFDARTIHTAFNRFPLKHGWDALALGQVLLRGNRTISQRWDAVRFYFDARGIDNLYPSLTRSGNAWSQLGIAIAYDFANGGDGEFYYDGGLWVPKNGLAYSKLDWREAIGDRETIGPVGVPVLYHTHHPYFRVRSALLKKMKIVILIRNIFESIESNFFKLAKAQDSTDEDDDAKFPWAKYADEAIEFYNSWGDVVRWHPRCLVFRYEDLVADPVGTHKAMTDHWGLDIPTACLEKAFAAITKDKMKERLADTGQVKNLRVSFRSRDVGMPDDRRRLIADMIRRKLNFDFGYGYE